MQCLHNKKNQSLFQQKVAQRRESIPLFMNETHNVLESVLIELKLEII